MKQNIDKLLDRDVALSNLATRADDLQSSATTYNQTTKQLRRKYWWKNAKVSKHVFIFIFYFLFIFLDKYMYCWYYCYGCNYHY